MSRRSELSAASLAQDLDARAFLALSLRNGALNLLTGGLFRFWGRNEVRRWIWDATDLEGEALDYGGTGLELLIGCLLRWALVGGALAGGFWTLREHGAMGWPLALAGLAAAAFFQGFSRFAGFVYLATRTEWRGAVFEVEGSPTGFALGELGDTVLSLITLGWWRPQADRVRDAKLWGGVRHQGRVLAFDAAGAARRPLYSAFAIGWFGTVMILLFAAGVLLGLAAGFFPTPDVGSAPTAGQLASLGALAVSLRLLMRGLWAPYQAARRTAIAAGLGLALDIDWRESARLQMTLDLARLISLGALSPWAQACESDFVFSRLRPLSNPRRVARLSSDVGKASMRMRGETHAVHAADL